MAFKQFQNNSPENKLRNHKRGVLWGKTTKSKSLKHLFGRVLLGITPNESILTIITKLGLEIRSKVRSG